MNCPVLPGTVASVCLLSSKEGSAPTNKYVIYVFRSTVHHITNYLHNILQAERKMQCSCHSSPGKMCLSILYQDLENHHRLCLELKTFLSFPTESSSQNTEIKNKIKAY